MNIKLLVVNKLADSAIVTVPDGKLEDLVKAKIAAEPMRSETGIRGSVKDGEVNPRDSATSYEHIGRAIALALECGATGTVVVTKPFRAITLWLCIFSLCLFAFSSVAQE